MRDMRWAADGSKICIIYEDGAVIMGGVDGMVLHAFQSYIGNHDLTPYQSATLARHSHHNSMWAIECWTELLSK